MSRTNTARARRVTTLVLGEPALATSANWMEIGPREAGVTVVSEKFARRRLPAPALAAMRSKPCFYMCVDDITAAVAHVPGRQLGAPTLAHGMRELCVETANGLVVLAEQVSAAT